MFASNSDRLALRNSNPAFGLDFVVRFEKNGRRSEITADNIDHALELSGSWIDKGANYVEIFRVLHDGSLNPTIGAHGELSKPLPYVGDERQFREDMLRATI